MSSSIIAMQKYYRNLPGLIPIGPRNPNHEAHIHSHFHYPDISINKDLKGFRICSVCRNDSINQIISSKDGSTSNLRKHLQMHHDEYLRLLEEEEEMPLLIPRGAKKLSECEGWNEASKQAVSKFEEKVVSAITKWIASDFLPLKVVESDNLRAVFNLLHHGMPRPKEGDREKVREPIHCFDH